MLKCTKFNFGWGSAPDSAGGPCTAPPGSLAGFKGPTSKGKKMGTKGKEWERGMGNKGNEVMEGRGGRKGRGEKTKRGRERVAS